jgi:hypothetical protein
VQSTDARRARIADAMRSSMSRRSGVVKD